MYTYVRIRYFMTRATGMYVVGIYLFIISIYKWEYSLRSQKNKEKHFYDFFY